MPTVLAPDGAALAFDAFDLEGADLALLVLPGWSDHAGRYAGLAERLRAARLAKSATPSIDPSHPTL